MTKIKCGIAGLSAALLLGGCAIHTGRDYEYHAAELYKEYQQKRDAEELNGEVRLIAADSLGRRLDRAHRHVTD